MRLQTYFQSYSGVEDALNEFEFVYVAQQITFEWKVEN